MGFKSMEDYNSQRYGNFFRLQNDNDTAIVVIMYRGTQDVMMADTHYVKSDEYSGYVTCCDKGCPACQKGLRVQPKIFVPVYVIKTSDVSGQTDCVQFWDRSTRFQPQLVNDVFRNYPNPSEYLFQITRHGVVGDINTTYDIRAIERNNVMSYDAICSKFNIKFPDCYNMVCRDVDSFELSRLVQDYGQNPTNSGYASSFNNGYGRGNYGSNYGGNYGGNYGAVPRGNSFTPNSFQSGNVGVPFSTQPGSDFKSTMPGVSLNTPAPDSAPDPDNLPFDGDSTSANPGVKSELDDPLQTNEDIDDTDLNF